MLGREDLGAHALGRVGARRGRWLRPFLHAYAFAESANGLRPAATVRNDALVDVDEQRDDLRHQPLHSEAQRGVLARDLGDEAPDDPGESGVDHPDDRGRAGDQAVYLFSLAGPYVFGQSSLVVVMAGHEVRLELRRDLEIGMTEAIHPGQEPKSSMRASTETEYVPR